jgi:hypothetical protein
MSALLEGCRILQNFEANGADDAVIWRLEEDICWVSHDYSTPTQRNFMIYVASSFAFIFEEGARYLARFSFSFSFLLPPRGP